MRKPLKKIELWARKIGSYGRISERLSSDVSWSTLDLDPSWRNMDRGTWILMLACSAILTVKITFSLIILQICNVADDNTSNFSFCYCNLKLSSEGTPTRSRVAVPSLYTNEILQNIFLSHDQSQGAIPRIRLRLRSWLVSNTNSLVATKIMILSWEQFQVKE